MTVETFSSKCQYSLHFGFWTSNACEKETEYLRFLSWGFWCMQVDYFLFFLPIVNVGVKQIYEAFESSLFYVLSSHIHGLIGNYNFSWDFMISFTEILRDHKFIGFLWFIF